MNEVQIMSIIYIALCFVCLVLAVYGVIMAVKANKLRKRIEEAIENKGDFK